MASAEKLAALGLDPMVVRLLTKRSGAGGVDGEKEKKQRKSRKSTPAEPSVDPAAPVVSEQPAASSASVQTLADIPAFTPEERESIISKVGRKSLSGLQWVGESLDKPGRAVRGLLAGKPGELLDIIPFSDTLGLTTPENDVSGRDVLEKYGVLGTNTPGLDTGDVAGFLGEVALDPLSWVSLGGATVAKNVVKEGAAGAKALTALDKLNEIQSGTRKLVQVHTPSLGVPLPSKIPFTNVGLPKLDLPVKVLGEYGTGAKAAKVYDAIQFGKYSPNPYVRKLFSPIEEVSTAPATGEAQKKGMQLYSERTRAMEDAATKANEWATEMAGTNVQLQDLQNKTFGDVEKIDPTRMRAEAVRTAYEASDEAKSLIRAEFGDDIRFDELLKDPKATGRLAEAYEKIVNNREAYGEFADEMEESFKTMEGMALDQMKAGADPRWFEDTARALVEAKDGVDLPTVLKTMKEAGFDEGIAGYDAAAQAMYQMVDKLRNMDQMEHKVLLDLGVNVGTWEDYYARHFFRGIDAPIGSPLYNSIKKKMVGSKAGFMESRDPIFNGIPGGTPKINKISMDPDFTATKYNKEFDKANWAKKGRNLFGPDVLAAPQPGSYLEPVHQMAKEAGYSWPMMQGIAREIKNLEKTARAGAIAARKQVYDVVEGIMGKGWRSSVNAAVKNDADWRAVKVLDEAMQGLSDRFGMDPDDIWETLKKHNQAAYVEKNGDQIALEAMAKYEELQKADRENPLFDLANDPTSYPDPAYNGGKLEATLDNRAYLLAKKYDLPAWWRFDEIVRQNLKNSSDPNVAAIAAKDQSEHAFKRELMEYEQARQAETLPEGERWTEGMKDVDDFISTYKLQHPELSKIPILSQPDLHALVKKFANMPQSVLKDGLFNRGVVRDAVDYMMQTAKVKAGVASMRKMLLEPGAIRRAKEGGTGVPLSEVWSDMDLTKQGLADFVKGIVGEVPEKEMIAAAEDMLVDPTVADMAKRYIELFKDTSDTLPWFEKAIDMGSSWWKATMTLPYIAFHTRNRAGGIVANWVAGILDGASDAEASKHFFGKTPIAEREALLNELKLYNIVSVGTDAGSTSKLNDRLDQYMGVGESKLPNSGGPLDYILAPFKEFKDDVVDAYRQGGVKKAARQMFTGGTTSTGKTASDLNPFGFSGGVDPLGQAGRKGQADVYGRPLSTIDRLKAPETTNVFGKVGTRANDYIEWMNRVGPYIYLRKNGWSPAMAARKVKQVQFDYRQLSPFEKKYMKRVIPFYSFMRKNIEQQIKLLIENPGGRTAQLIRAENVANKEGRSNGSYVPKYLAESFSVRLPGGTDKDAQFYSQSGLLPAEEAFNRLSFKDDGFPINAKRTAEKFMAMTNPVIQGPMEWLSGRQFWSGRNLDDLYQSPTSDQDVNLALSKLPTQRLTGTIGGLLDSRKSIPLRAFNAVVGGAKVTDVNVAKQRALELRDILEQELPRDADIASFTGLYPKDLEKLISRFNAGDVEAAQMLKLYADLKQELKTIKAQEAAGTSATP